MIRKFSRTEGRCIEKIEGQERLAFSLSDPADFYDLAEWSENGGYPGNEIQFYDFQNGHVEQPFSRQRNILYSRPIYSDGFFYFLQGNYEEQTIVLYRYLPETGPEAVTELDMEKVDLYNLCLMGSGIHIASQGDVFRCYYPEKFSFPLEAQESAVLMEDGKVYCEVWVEEGWDEEKNCASENYRCYDRIRVRDFQGKILSEEIGSLCHAQDGTWWIA